MTEDGERTIIKPFFYGGSQLILELSEDTDCIRVKMRSDSGYDIFYANPLLDRAINGPWKEKTKRIRVPTRIKNDNPSGLSRSQEVKTRRKRKRKSGCKVERSKSSGCLTVGKKHEVKDSKKECVLENQFYSQ